MARRSTPSSPLVYAKPAEITQLSRICALAAEHVSLARVELDGADPSRALAHLDSAISCLKRLVLQSRSLAANSKNSDPRYA